jgi:hypothetical protein
VADEYMDGEQLLGGRIVRSSHRVDLDQRNHGHNNSHGGNCHPEHGDSFGFTG